MFSKLTFHVLSEMLISINCFHRIPSATGPQVLHLLVNQEQSEVKFQTSSCGQGNQSEYFIGHTLVRK